MGFFVNCVDVWLDLGRIWYFYMRECNVYFEKCNYGFCVVGDFGCSRYIGFFV